MDPKWLRELSLTARLAERLLASPEFARAQEDFLRNTVNIAGYVGDINEIARKAAESQALLDASRSLSNSIPFTSLASDTAVLTQQAGEIAQYYNAIFRSAAFAGVLDEVERILPILERHRPEIVEAENETARRLAMREAVQALVEGTTGLDTRIKTRYDRIRFWTAVFMILIHIAYGTYAYHSELEQNRQISDLKRLHREQAHTIATLAESVRQIQQQYEKDQSPSGPRLVVENNGNLREGPSSTTPRVAQMRPGDGLELIVSLGRWYFVEMLTPDGHRSGLRGWIYRRAVRHVRPNE